MSNFQTITPTVEGLSGSAPQIWSAVTSDSSATVVASGYLNDIALKLGIKANDIMFVNTSDASTFPMQTGLSATLMEYQVTYSAPNWSLIVANPEGFATVTLPTVANVIPTFSNTAGNLVDSSHSIIGNFFVGTAANGLTAHAGGGQTNALLLTADVINNVTTVATTADSVKLPPSNVGESVTIANNGANSMQVFGSGTDTINSVATGTGVSQAAGTTVTYRVNVAGNWLAVLPPAPGNVVLINQINTFTAGNGFVLTKGTGTVSSNAVTINAQAGVITTTSLSTASGASATATTLTNSFIAATSAIFCNVIGGTNTTNGITITAVPGAGSASIVLTNGNVAAAALNGTVIYSFLVV